MESHGDLHASPKSAVLRVLAPSSSQSAFADPRHELNIPPVSLRQGSVEVRMNVDSPARNTRSQAKAQARHEDAARKATAAPSAASGSAAKNSTPPSTVVVRRLLSRPDPHRHPCPERHCELVSFILAPCHFLSHRVVKTCDIEDDRS